MVFRTDGADELTVKSCFSSNSTCNPNALGTTTVMCVSGPYTSIGKPSLCAAALVNLAQSVEVILARSSNPDLDAVRLQLQ